MYKEIDNDVFVREMQILWQNVSIPARKGLGNVIRAYFEGNRAELIINKLQDSI